MMGHDTICGSALCSLPQSALAVIREVAAKVHTRIYRATVIIAGVMTKTIIGATTTTRARVTTAVRETSDVIG